MNISAVRGLTPAKRLFYWMQEREKIRAYRAQGFKPPWTDDEILQKYRFCNVRRMDDKVSQWLLKHWYQPYKNHPNMLVAATMARHFNLPSTLQLLTPFVFDYGPPPEWKLIKRMLRKAKKNGPIFNGAYMVRGMSKREPNWTAVKSDQIIDRMCKPMVKRPPVVDTSSMQNTVESLLPYWGFSTFMAGQVVADLRHTLTGTWKDKWTWAPIGPGSKRGMNRYFGRPVDQPLHQDQFLEELIRNVIPACEKNLRPELTQRLEAIDYQNCLCELDKYSRALLGEGKPKQLYRGGV